MLEAELRRCLGCQSELPRPFLDLGLSPLANAYVDPSNAELPDTTFPLAVSYCPSCHLVQLKDRVDPTSLFIDYPYFSSYSESFLAHAREMAGVLIKRFKIGSESRVLEVASNDGYLLQYFLAEGIPVLGVEPAKNIAATANGKGIPTLDRFFGLDTSDEVVAKLGGSADLVIGNNVLAHVPSINDFMAAVVRCLKGGGVAVFEFPYLQHLIESVEFDTIYHEHVFYYSLHSIRNLATRAALEIFDVEHLSVHGGSLRVFLGRPREHQIEPSVEMTLRDEVASGLTDAQKYEGFSRRVTELRSALLEKLRGLRRAGKRIAAYGAPAKGNTLLNYCGIGPDLVEFTVDRNPHKQGRLLPGSRIPIRPPEHLLAELPDYTLILPWNITDEIVSQQAEYRRRGGRFLVPIPQPREVL